MHFYDIKTSFLREEIFLRQKYFTSNFSTPKILLHFITIFTIKNLFFFGKKYFNKKDFFSIKILRKLFTGKNAYFTQFFHICTKNNSYAKKILFSEQRTNSIYQSYSYFSHTFSKSHVSWILFEALA